MFVVKSTCRFLQKWNIAFPELAISHGLSMAAAELRECLATLTSRAIMQFTVQIYRHNAIQIYRDILVSVISFLALAP